MTSKERVLNRERQRGYEAAKAVQATAENMTGTELNAVDDNIPRFRIACEKMNMMKRKAGDKDGFVCKSSAGRVVRLIQNYDSDILTAEPEDLPAQWRFVWSTDPKKALQFISLSTSPYATGDCCINDGYVWQSGQDGNVWAPGTVGVKWNKLGTIEEIQGGLTN